MHSTHFEAAPPVLQCINRHLHARGICASDFPAKWDTSLLAALKYTSSIRKHNKCMGRIRMYLASIWQCSLANLPVLLKISYGSGKALGTGVFLPHLYLLGVKIGGQKRRQHDHQPSSQQLEMKNQFWFLMSSANGAWHHQDTTDAAFSSGLMYLNRPNI